MVRDGSKGVSPVMKDFVVIGLGRFGSSVLKSLYAQGYNVLGIDRDEARVNALMECATRVIAADATDENVLKNIGIRNFDVAVVAIGELQASILITLLLKEFGIPMVVAKASDDLHGKVLSKIGADRVVYPEREMGVRVAHNLVASNILDFIELSPDYSILEISAGKFMTGKSLRELDFRNRFGVNVIAIKRDKGINLSPKADDRIYPGDIMVVVGDNESLRRLENEVAD